MNNIIVRFPPSPTGFLHIGNARIALINWLFAKKNNGKIILRFDDTDTERTQEHFKAQMREDLTWLGITFDEFFEQSKREAIYKDIFNKLLEQGFVYPCFETEEELELKRKLALSSGKPPLYKKHEFTAEQKLRTPYFRFHLSQQKAEWEDLIQGKISFETKDLSDPTILRANGNFMYTFCSVVDDVLMNISHIIRGADHITNTAIQIQIFNAICTVLGKVPKIFFAHLPLFQGKEGKISKRVGGFSIMEMRKNGFEAEAILNILSKIGLSYYDDNIKTTHELIENFDLANFNKAQITFDFNLLESFNQKCIAKMSFEQAKPRLSANITEHFFTKIKENLENLQEAEEWFQVFHDETLNFLDLLTLEDQDFIKQFGEIITQLNTTNWAEISTHLKQKFPARTGKKLFLPIRIAITGKEHGPEMNFILEELGVDLIKKRLKK